MDNDFNNSTFYTNIKENSGLLVPQHRFVSSDLISETNCFVTENEIDKIDFLNLWQLNDLDNNIVLKKDSIDFLAKRYSIFLNSTFLDAKIAITSMIKALSLSDFFIEKVVFKMEGNWLLKHQNEHLQGLLQTFLYWFAYKIIKEEEISENYLIIFMNKYAKDVNLEILNRYEDDKIMSAFIQSFCKFKNNLVFFNNILNNIEN